MEFVFYTIVVTVLAASLGGIIVREMFVRKGQNPDRGLYLGTVLGLPGILYNIDVGNAFLSALVDGLLPLAIAIPLIAVLLPTRALATQHATIPFYRDVEVLRVESQVFFAALFIGTLILLWISLTGNLADSEFALDFNIYERRFGAGLSEGIRFDTDWDWFDELGENPIAYGTWVTILGLVGFSGYRYFRHETRWIAIACAVGAAALILLSPIIIPFLEDTFTRYLQPFSMTRAIMTGFSNTLRIVAVSIVASTVVGVLVGIGLLSNNYLVRNISVIFTEIFRNTPLLVQLILIYQAMLIILPAEFEGAEDLALTSPDSILGFTLHEELYAFSSVGFKHVSLEPTQSSVWLFGSMILGVVVGYLVRRYRLHLQDTKGTPARTWRFVVPIFVAFTAVGWLIAGKAFTADYPGVERVGVRFEYVGGSVISLPFVATFIGLSLYTAAFIADIVRAGIQSVPTGQIEAARSLGLRGGQVLSMIVLPQALRLIIPPLGNQYVNLGKNSTLGFAIGFAEAYTAVQLANNESGQSVPFFVGLMVIYLLLSLTLSVMTNLVNSTTRIRAR